MADKLFDRICAIAAAGERCPKNTEIDGVGLSQLARAGKIRIEVFNRNWRIVTILSGEHAGKQTARGPNPVGARPYITIDAKAPRRTDMPPRIKQSQAG
jgi:hypothetical protein